jgi:glycerol-3-phosphate O-acyltransferase
MAQDLGAPVSKQLEGSPSSPIVLGPVQDAMRMFASEEFVRIAEARGEPIYQVEDERRLELSFYKNTLVNLMAGRTIVAAALLATGPDAPVSRIREKALFLSRLFKFELIFKAGQSFDSIFDETLLHLERLGLVLRDKDVARPAPESWAKPQLEFLADLIRDFLESYRLTVHEAQGLPATGLDRKDFYRRALESGRAEFLAGTLPASEALSKLNLENAVQWLVDQQYLVDKDKKLSLGAKPLAELMTVLREFLPENR